MTDYDIQRISRAVVELLLSDERVLARIGRHAKAPSKLLNTQQAAVVLGVSPFTVRRLAAELGGIQGPGGRWSFPESTLVEKYLTHKNSK
jgi:hypothetical protein